MCWERFFPSPAPGDFDVRTAWVIVDATSLSFVQGPQGMQGGSSIGVDERRPDVAAIDNQIAWKTLCVWQNAFDIEARMYDNFGPVSNAFAGSANAPNGVMFAWLDESNSVGLINDIHARVYEPVTSFVSPYGSACAGPGGTLPTIQTDGDPYPGNLEFAIELSNAPSGSLAALLISNTLTTAPIPGAPGCTLYVDFPLLLAMPTITTATGDASVSVPIPVGAPPGALLGFQWGVYTPGYNAFGWIASGALDISWQQ